MTENTASQETSETLAISESQFKVQEMAIYQQILQVSAAKLPKNTYNAFSKIKPNFLHLTNVRCSYRNLENEASFDIYFFGNDIRQG